MSIAIIVFIVALSLIAFINGANDVSKSIATLAGSGVTDYRRAILWGTVFTGAGAIAGAMAAQAMVTTFGSNLLSKGTAPTFAAALSVILGAAGWVALATWTGMPVSTTHAIVGSVTGVALIAYGVAGINWIALVDKIALPLLLSPVVALALSTGVILGVRTVQARFGEQANCLCADFEPAPALLTIEPGAAAASIVSTEQLRFTAASTEACDARQSRSLKLTTAHLHWISSGATSFARGMNDAPKMAALFLGASMLHVGPLHRAAAFAIVGTGMMAGSWIAGRRVTTVLAERVTSMDDWEGLVANLVTATLVAPGAALGLPMSTTHVSSSSIVGVGLRKNVNWKTVREMVLAWVVTLPVSGFLGVLIYEALNHFHA